VKRHITKFVALVISWLVFCPLFAQDEIPLLGATKTIQTTICRIKASAIKEKKTINNVYAAPKGWQIVTYKPVIIANTAKASYKFSQTAPDFSFSSTSPIYSKFIELFELAAEKNVFQKYERQIAQTRSDFEKYYNKEVPLFSTITTAISVSRNNYTSRRTGQLYIDLKITVVFMPTTEEGVLQSLGYLKHLINSEN
jgi:hypothetical protein